MKIYFFNLKLIIGILMLSSSSLVAEEYNCNDWGPFAMTISCTSNSDCTPAFSPSMCNTTCPGQKNVCWIPKISPKCQNAAPLYPSISCSSDTDCTEKRVCQGQDITCFCNTSQYNCPYPQAPNNKNACWLTGVTSR